MRIGVVLRNSGPEGVDAVRRVTDLAGELGYDGVWASDHVLAPASFAQRYGREWLDPFVSLTVAAERSTTLALGFSVLVVPYRPALPTARAIASLQDLSGGRVIVGCGSGWLEEEFAALGEDFADRGQITDERVDLIRAALAGGRADFAAPTRPLPMLAAGNSARNLERATRLDGWHPIARTPDEVAAGTQRLPAGHRVALRTRLGLGRDRKDRPLFGTQDEVVADVAAYVSAGVTDLVVDHAADDLADVVRGIQSFAKLIGEFRG
jgi:alkanesulfonate monooxygenase SsuD/methylene tetrahydromethanopterin reductase-like flavin-dependent oxidoreductase (luciferase family)